MSAYSSPYKTTQPPIYIDDDLSPVKLPSTNINTSSIRKSYAYNHQGSHTPVKEITNLDQSSFQKQQQQPYTENITKTNYLNINSATKKSIDLKRNRSSISDTTTTTTIKPSRYSLTSPLRKKRLTSNLDSIKKSNLKLDLTINKLNNDRNKRLKNLEFNKNSKSSLDNYDDDIENNLSSPIKRNRSFNNTHQIEIENITDEDIIEIGGRKLSNDSIIINDDNDDNNDNNNDNNEKDKDQIQEISNDVEIGRRIEIEESSGGSGSGNSIWRKQSPINPQLSSDFEIDSNFMKEPSATLTHSQFTKLINESKQERLKTPDNPIEIEEEEEEEKYSKIKSPNQNTDSNYELSPLRHDIDIIKNFENNEKEQQEQELNEYEDEPTINFINPTNLKPLFSMNHITKLEKNHENKINQLYIEINDKNQEIQNLQQQLNKTNDENKKIQYNNELINLTITTMEKDIASLNKQNKILENSNLNFRRKLNDYKISINEMEIESKNWIDNKNEFETTIVTLRSQIDELNNSKTDLENNINQIKIENEETSKKNQVLESKIKELEKYNQEIIKNYENESNDKIQSLESSLTIKDSLIDSLKTDKLKLITTNKENENLIKELDQLINSSKQDYENDVKHLNLKYITEIDNLNKSINEFKNDKNQLELELISKTNELNNIVKSNDVEINKLKEENKNQKLEFERSEKLYKEEIEEKKQELITISTSYEKLELELSSKISELNELDSNFDRQVLEYKEIKSIANEYEIRIDHNEIELSTQSEKLKIYELKFQELITAIESQKSTHQQQLTKIESLELQISENEKEKIIQEDNLIKYLHKEYSLKHQTKMNEIKLHYDQELAKQQKEIKSLSKNNEFLSKKIEDLNYEYQLLLKEKSE
ncbi:uncharacterized protein KGF55_001041 [Candida pseudojiufengensis]|uniref:uncharacterized protein n=1 Tax=Candida pseudojiufengensis TaxID=497109 RepID=UPI00222578C8|nr:uncharacterized protein KGF55_001041 [Candida pseudojiufengensis]KAI5965679.1 hypothetical protein KGF55_001041 [Candida pseudojiufengensis]